MRIICTFSVHRMASKYVHVLRPLNDVNQQTKDKEMSLTHFYTAHLEATRLPEVDLQGHDSAEQ